MGTSFDAQVTNNTRDQIVVDLSTTDFTALNETGGVTFLPNTTNDLHGLAQWLKPTYGQITLSPGASQTIPVTIAPKVRLAPGGHYGAILYRVDASSSLKGNQFNANEEVSTLVFLTTYGDSTQAIALHTPSLNSVMFNTPSSLNLVFTNSGNTQTTPRGLVIITGSAHKEIARGIVNIDSGLVLPGTTRLYSVSLTAEQHLHYPGIYSLQVSYRPDGAKVATVYTKTFLFVNWVLFLGFGVVVVLAILAFWLIRRFKYNRRYR
jgi:hypothetical protein